MSLAWWFTLEAAILLSVFAALGLVAAGLSLLFGSSHHLAAFLGALAAFLALALLFLLGAILH